MIYIGIDPGQKGGIACINNDKVYVTAMPLAGREVDGNAIYKWLITHTLYETNTIACVEKVHSMPKQGVSSSFKFGKNYGIVIGVLSALGVSIKLVTPQRWKRAILFDTKRDKQAAIEYCRLKYPNVNLLASKKSRVPHSGIADALCIASYAKSIL